MITTNSTQTFVSTLSKKIQTVVRKYIQNAFFSIHKIFHYQSQVLELVKQILDDRHFIRLGQADQNMCIFQEKGSNIMVAKYTYIQHDFLHQQDHTFIQENTANILELVLIKIFKGEVFYFYTYQNIFFSSATNEITLNKLSIVGLLPILLKTRFKKEDFVQIYQLLDESFFQEKQTSNRKKLLTYRTKFRAIGMLILHLIFKKRVSFLLEKDLSPFSEYIQFGQAYELVKKQRQKFQHFFSAPQIIMKIQKAERRDSINYIYFLQNIFIKDFKNVDWRQTFDLLIPKYQLEQGTNLSLLQDYNEQIKRLAQNRFKLQIQNEGRKYKWAQMGIQDQIVYLIYRLDCPNLKYITIGQQLLQQKSSSYYYQCLFHSLIRIKDQIRVLEQNKVKQFVISPPQTKKVFKYNPQVQSSFEYTIVEGNQEQRNVKTRCVEDIEEQEEYLQIYQQHSKQKNPKQQKELQQFQNQRDIVDKMCNSFKVFATKFQDKIDGIDPNLAILRAYRKILWLFDLQFLL